MPGALSAIEHRLRSLVQSRIARGRVEIAITAQQRRLPTIEVELNEPLLDALRGALERARDRGYLEGVISAGDLLRFPQALTVREKADDPAADEPPMAARVEETVASALDELEGMRVREGEFLRADLERRRLRLGELFDGVARASDAGMAGLEQRLAQRVKDLRADAMADETLVAQEIARFVGRSDITEEVVRFRGHLEHWRALVESPEPCGRKLDFLLQEMNREVNTAGSKAEGPAVSELIVELKADLEKMREQVQNVE
jgi:uncharacterized protein (TIGR00255 family)